MPRTNSESDFGGSITSDGSGDEFDLGPSSPIQAAAAPTQPFGSPTQAVPPTRERLNMDTYVNPSQAAVPPSTPPAQTASGKAKPQLTPIRKPRSITSIRSPKSPLAALRSSVVEGPNPSTLRGAARFRATVRKVMQLHKTSTFLGAFRGAGAEPGVDVRRASAIQAYGHLRESCSIQLVDYSAVRMSHKTYTNKTFIDLLEEKGTARPEWAKVRWIAVGGISWDVISALALTYGLHPLALEDILHKRNGHMRSKADYYNKHLFLRILCHTLSDQPDDPLQLHAEEHRPSNITDAPRSQSPTRYDSSIEKGYEGGDETLTNKSTFFRRRTGTMKSRKSTAAPDVELGRRDTPPPPYFRTSTGGAVDALATIDDLKAGQRVNVAHKNFFIFLFRNGTVISIHQSPGPAFFEPIVSRLRTPDTVLRSTADPSLLVHSQIDLVVDQVVEIVEEYQKMILKLERDILLRPKIRSVRQLHILSGDLSTHKLTMDPMKSLVYGLRRYDLDRCVAVAQSQAETAEQAAEEARKVTGYMSHKTKVYLADVYDHTEYILSSLELFANVSENLINYTFNMASYKMNETMRLFTIVTIIFLPLTFLSGYFGMNFTPFSAVDNHSDVLFWEIALPIMAVIIPMVLWSDIVRVKHYCEKKVFAPGGLPRGRGRRY